MKNKMVSVILVVVLLSLMLAGCGDDSSDSADAFREAFPGSGLALLVVLALTVIKMRMSVALTGGDPVKF